MSKLANGEEFVRESPYIPESDSLLRKYEIPVSHLDFKYVEQCRNVKELEKILQILQSGEEGYYPDLIACTEARLSELHPMSKMLRKQVPVLRRYDLNSDELNNIVSDVEVSSRSFLPETPLRLTLVVLRIG